MGGDRQEEPEQRLPAVLPLGRRDLQVDGIASGLAREAGERIGDEEEEREHVDFVAQVGRDEAVQGLGEPPRDQRGEPADDQREEDGDPPEDEPDEVRDGQEQPEEDREP